MASTDPQDAASFASTVSLGKRTRSASPPSGNGQGDHAGKNGHAQAGEGESDSDDDDVGPMPVPEGAESDDETGPLPASAKSGAGSSKAAAKRRKILKYEKVYLDNLPSADRYYSGSTLPIESQRTCILKLLQPLCHRIVHAQRHCLLGQRDQVCKSAVESIQEKKLISR